MDEFCVNNGAVNTYDGISDIGYKIIEYLMQNNENMWKMLKYNTPDALHKPNLTMREKADLIFNGTNEESIQYRVFRSPYLDDLGDEQVSQVRVFIESINPDTHIYGTIDVNIEVITHVKLVNLSGYKSRIEALMEEVLKTLNGKFVGGVGLLMFDRKMSFYDLIKLNLFNNRNFFGYSIIMSTKWGTVDGGNCC